MTESNWKYCIGYEDNLPKENKFEFQDIVRYKWLNQKYQWCEWMVVDQFYNRCFRDYETKVIIKLQWWYQQEIFAWWGSLEKVDHTKHQWR